MEPLGSVVQLDNMLIFVQESFGELAEEWTEGLDDFVYVTGAGDGQGMLIGKRAVVMVRAQQPGEHEEIMRAHQAQKSGLLVAQAQPKGPGA